MALNLSTLTSPATSGDVLAEALTTADFLEGVPVLRNLARGSQKGGDAKQDVALNQPKALPLIDGDGYLYVPDVVSNTCSTPDDSSIDITGDITIDIDLTLKNWNDGTERNLVSKYLTANNQRSYRLFVTPTNRLSFVISSSGAFESGGSRSPVATINFPDNQRAQIRVQWRSSDGRVQFFTSTDKGQTFTQLGVDLYTSGITSIYNGTADLDIAHRTNLNRLANSAIHSVQIYDSVTPSSSSLRFNCDFTATNVRHGDTKFACATGQVVTVNQSGNDPATIIKKPVLRFDGVNDFMDGVFGQTIADGYMFAAFSVLGNGGDSSGRVFSINSTGITDAGSRSAIFSQTEGTRTNLQSFYNGTPLNIQSNLFDDSNGDILHEALIKNGSQKGGVNNANFLNTTLPTSIESEEFNISCNPIAVSARNTAIDLEFLALFSAESVPDEATASKIRNYINNRNNVFDLKDGFGYYFFDPQIFPIVSPAAFVSFWGGNIVGSDNTLNASVSQSTVNDQPTRDGYKVTFNDNADHLVAASPLSGGQAGWQVVGTSLGTFAYRVNNNAVAELNLLGNLGNVSYRQAGQSYGMILLPDSATGADIEAARKLLIDRGASDGVAPSDCSNFWRGRADIVIFKSINFNSVTNITSAWRGNSSMTTFSVSLPSVAQASNAFLNCSSLSDFETTDLKNCSNFTSAWKGCSALTSFPAAAKLGTSAVNVNFTSAWRSSGLTSFSTPLPTATNLSNAFLGCSSLESFSTPLPKAEAMGYSWYNCSSLTDFSSDVFTNWNPSSIGSGVFNLTWDGCTSLTADSVEAILTSIDASGKYATSTGASGGSALADAGIDIDYNGDPLSAATTAAIDSLSGKGWEVFINGVLVIPNILDLQPAAAYSLRSFDADADPNVVNVRRSSDSALRDFKASEVSDGTLTSWVNTEYETVTNGEFTTDSGWSKGTGWSIANGKATSDGTQTGLSYLFQSSNMGASQSQRATLVVSGYTAGTVKVRLGNSAPSSSVTSAISSNGTHVFTLPSHSDPSILFIEADADFQGSIESISVVQLTADGHVTTWYDQSGSNHATQTVAASQPLLVESGTLVTVNSKPLLYFDGNNDSFSIPAGLISNLDTLLVSAVLTNSDGNNDYGVVLGEPNNRIYVPYVNSNNLNIGYHDSAVKLQDGTYSNGLQLVTLSVDSSTASGFKNGQAFSTVATATASSNPPTVTTNANKIGTFGSQVAGAFDFSEVVIFNTDQSANRTGIETNINDHFDIYS